MTLVNLGTQQGAEAVLAPLQSESVNGKSLSPPSSTGDTCGALLPEPSLIGGDIGAEVALLSIRAGRDQQKIQESTEEAQNNIQDLAEQNEVKEMHTEASDIMSSAWAAGVMQVGQGVAQISGAGQAPSEQGAYTGTAGLYGAGATLFTAQGQSQRELDEALVTSFKAVADRAGQMSTEASQGKTDAEGVITNAIQFYQQYEQTKAQVDLVAAGQKA
jgi:hypothetical protein